MFSLTTTFAMQLGPGGERSFSTLCFALALHGMTEAPFRAMDEFDVFMVSNPMVFYNHPVYHKPNLIGGIWFVQDAVSRKISLDTLVDFAVAQGSQWVFITPHDIRSENCLWLLLFQFLANWYLWHLCFLSMVKPGDRVKKQQMAAPRGWLRA